LASHGFEAHAFRIGAPAQSGAGEQRLRIAVGALKFDESWSDLRRAWSETSWQMRRLRDDPECADQEFSACTHGADPGLCVALAFDPEEEVARPYIVPGVRPS